MHFMWRAINLALVVAVITWGAGAIWRSGEYTSEKFHQVGDAIRGPAASVRAALSASARYLVLTSKLCSGTHARLWNSSAAAFAAIIWAPSIALDGVLGIDADLPSQSGERTLDGRRRHRTTSLRERARQLRRQALVPLVMLAPAESAELSSPPVGIYRELGHARGGTRFSSREVLADFPRAFIVYRTPSWTASMTLCLLFGARSMGCS